MIWIRTWDDPVAFYTFILSIFTALLAIVSAFQIIFLIRADKTARITANAAKESSEAATAIEFPIIGASYIGPELDSTDELVRPNTPYGSRTIDGWPTNYCVVPSIEFLNYGRTPAFVDHIEAGIAATLGLPETPIYRTFVPVARGTVIEERNNKEIETHFGFVLSDDEVQKIGEATAILWLYIALVYTDVRNKRYEARFCWKWGRQNPTADGISYFFDDGSAPAAYTRKT